MAWDQTVYQNVGSRVGDWPSPCPRTRPNVQGGLGFNTAKKQPRVPSRRLFLLSFLHGPKMIRDRHKQMPHLGACLVQFGAFRSLLAAGIFSDESCSLTDGVISPFDCRIQALTTLGGLEPEAGLCTPYGVQNNPYYNIWSPVARPS